MLQFMKDTVYYLVFKCDISDMLKWQIDKKSWHVCYDVRGWTGCKYLWQIDRLAPHDMLEEGWYTLHINQN